jgi:hypothetical protein
MRLHAEAGIEASEPCVGRHRASEAERYISFSKVRLWASTELLCVCDADYNSNILRLTYRLTVPEPEEWY